MSHHFDTVLAKEDPRLNVADMYLFEGEPGRTVMVMTSNADALISAPDTLHEEGLYAFRVDHTGEGKEELAFKFRFEAPEHAAGDEHRHVQSYRVLRAEGPDLPGLAGQTILEGCTGEIREQNNVRAFVGIVPELWAADAFAFVNFVTALHAENRFAPEAFQSKDNFFKNRNVLAIVLEVPNWLIGYQKINAWSSISLYGHAPEVQVSRWGIPLFTHLFLSGPTVAHLIEDYHRANPSEDREKFGPAIEKFASHLASLAHSTETPEAHGKKISSLICPSMLPYELGTAAEFTTERFNGRPLGADVLDVMFSLAAGIPISDGISPDLARLKDTFPYYGQPYTEAEQIGLLAFPELRGYFGKR